MKEAQENLVDVSEHQYLEFEFLDGYFEEWIANQQRIEGLILKDED